MRAMKNIKLIGKATITLGILLALLCCNPIADDSKSATRLVLVTLTGVDMDSNVTNYLESDVLYQDPDKGIETIYADKANAQLTAELLDPASISGPSQYNDIMLTHYVVTYFRSDGHNVEGIDIPHSFEGYLSERVAVGTTATVDFIIVRLIAKAEPPLVDLATGRDEGVLTVTARVDLYGHDMVNKNVKVSGYLTIHFANYANTSGGEEE
jgi:hypothetical protein